MKKILKLDASLLKKSACARLLYLIGIEGYRSEVSGHYVVYGLAFHKFAETYQLNVREHGSDMAQVLGWKECLRTWNTVPKSINPEKKYLDASHLARTCDIWRESLTEDSFVFSEFEGKPLVELKFSINVYEDDEVVVLLCGTIDKIGRIQKGCYCIGDYKTAGQLDFRNPEAPYDKYFRQYRLDPQLRTYLYALKWYGKTYPNSIFSEICSSGKIGCFIDGIFLRPNLCPKTDNIPVDASIVRSPMFFYSEDDQEEYTQMLNYQVQTLIRIWKTNPVLPVREGIINGTCNTIYGGCQFAYACGSVDNFMFRQTLDRTFVKKPYDPMNFH